MIDDAQEAQLTGGGECFVHYHPLEPLNFDDHVDLVESEPVTEVTGDYTATSNDFHIRADTTNNNITITLPLSADTGRDYQITKLVSANLLYIVPTAPDTIIGRTGVTVRNAYTSLHCKSVEEGWQFV